MAYREPAVRVTQEFVNALPALATFALPHVNVGPAFQVKSKGDAGDYLGLAANYSYPGQIAGSYIDTRAFDANDLLSFPVKVELNETVLRILNVVATGQVPVNLNQFSDATLNAFLNVQVGDVISVTGSGLSNDGLYTVREKLSNNLVQINETFAAAEASLSYSVRRNVQSAVGDIDVTSSATISSTQVSLPLALTYTLAPFGAVPVISANVLITYRAQRIEKSSDVWEYTKVSELQADFGLDQIVPENPVVFAAYISLLSAAVQTNLVALNSSFLADELLSYQNALDSVLSLTEMYAINVLSHSSAVHTALKSHCETLSLPDNALERVGICNRQIVLVGTVVDEITTGGAEGLAGTGNLVLTSAASEFITDGVVPGHFIAVSAPSLVAGRYEIASVDSQTQVTLVGPVPAASNGVTFSVEKDLQKGEQAAILSAYAASLGSRRLVMVWPDQVKGPVGSEIRTLPGYFLGATIGALTTGLPTQQGLTNLSVGYFTGVKNSTKYFDRTQLNVIASGGVMIFAQDVIDVTALYVRHQLTTDTSAIKFQEYSVTKNVDFIAKFIRNNHKQFIGQYNIVESTFDDLKSNATGIIKYLTENTRIPRFGGVISSGRLVSIEQDPQNIDTIIEKWSLAIPIPLNNLDITIVV
jgi:hypothetical protein